MFSNIPKTLSTILLCIIAEVLNLFTVDVFYHFLDIPLFFDTIWTVAVVFYLGLIPGLVVSIGYNIINTLLLVWQEGYFDPFVLMYGICGIFTVLSTWFIARRKAEFKISVTITILYLVLIVLLASFFSIICGGVINFFRYKHYEIPDMMNPIKNFTTGFVYMRFSFFVSCILAQIPTVLLDRFIATFAGFGIYTLWNKFMEKRMKSLR